MSLFARDESIAQLIAETQHTDRQVSLALAHRDSYPDDVADVIAENRRPVD